MRLVAPPTKACFVVLQSFEPLHVGMSFSTNSSWCYPALKYSIHYCCLFILSVNHSQIPTYLAPVYDMSIDAYSAYNKPLSITHWLQNAQVHDFENQKSNWNLKPWESLVFCIFFLNILTQVKEDIIIIIDPDCAFINRYEINFRCWCERNEGSAYLRGWAAPLDLCNIWLSYRISRPVEQGEPIAAQGYYTFDDPKSIGENLIPYFKFIHWR